MDPLQRQPTSIMMKAACYSRIQRQQRQSLDYANATYMGESPFQSQASTQRNGIDGEQDNSRSYHDCGTPLESADDYNWGSGYDSRIYNDSLESSGNLGSRAQSPEVPRPPLQGPDPTSSRANNTGAASGRTPAWLTALPIRLKESAKRRNLHGNWRLRDEAPVAPFARDGVLDGTAEDREQPKQPALPERYAPSSPDPEPWQASQQQRKGSSHTKWDIQPENIPWEESKLQHGLLQELDKKHKNEQIQNSSTSTSERRTSAVQGGQNAPTRAKRLLKIYKEVKGEIDVVEGGLSPAEPDVMADWEILISGLR